MPEIMLSKKDTPGNPVVRPQKHTMGYFSKKAEVASERFGFRSYLFEPSERNSEKITGILNKSIKKKWKIEDTEKECARQNLAKAETAFALNFAHVYWPGFENEANLRESPEDMIAYLLKELPSNIGSLGYGSYFISLLAADGRPAGFVTGAVGDIVKLFERFGMEKPDKEMTVTFIGYVALPEWSQGQRADMILLTKLEEFVQGMGRKTDYFIAQVDRPKDFEAELALVERKIKSMEKKFLKSMKVKKLTETRGDYEERIHTAHLLLRLWEGRYSLGHVKGLRSMEIIHDYQDTKAPLLSAEKQPQLELLIRSATGSEEMPYSELVWLLKGLYTYYGAFPGVKVKGTEMEALDEYMRYSLENVVSDGKNVKLSRLGEN